MLGYNKSAEQQECADVEPVNLERYALLYMVPVVNVLTYSFDPCEC